MLTPLHDDAPQAPANACFDCGELLDPFTYDGGPLVTQLGRVCERCAERAA